MAVNKISLYQEGGSLNKDSANIPMEDLTQLVQEKMNSGEPAESVLYYFLQQGIQPEQLGVAFESVGYDPSTFTELLQSTSQMAAEMQQAQQAEMQQQQVEPSMIQPQNQEQPQMQYGGNTTARGPLESKAIPRPLYMPPVPGQANMIGAAYMLSDALGEFVGKEDENKDDLRDGTFQDWSAKNARYKKKQLGNRTYEVDFGSNDPSNYVPTWEDLAEGKVRTNQEYQNDLFENSQLTFNPETNKYESNIGASQLDLDTYGVDQRIKNGLGLKDFVGNIEDLSQEERDMIRSGMSYEPGQMLGQNSSTDASWLSRSELKDAQELYKQIMLGQQSPMGDMNTADPSVNSAPAQRNIVQLANSEKPMVTNQPSFKEWMVKNAFSLQGLSPAQMKEQYDNTEFKYGGNIPKAQFNIPDNLFGGLTQGQLQNPEGFTDMITNSIGTPDYQTGVQIAKDAQLQNRQPGLGPTPFEQQTANATATTPGLADFTGSGIEDESLMDPTVTRKRSLGNAYDQVETFIKDNPAMQAFGDVSQAVVMGANFANQMFQQKEFNDYRNKLRNTTVADNVYLANENPVNKRGTFDVNTGLAEPDNLVDYYARAMYGKETYKKGGEFKPHMMYDPISGKAYEAKVEADHNRFAKMGFVHENEMQQGGEVEVDQETLAALIAAGADIEML